MGCLIKTIVGFCGLLLLCTLLVFGGLWALETYGPEAVASEFERQTSFRIAADDVDASIAAGKIDLQGLHVRNPEGWPEDNFLTVDSFRCDLDYASLRDQSQRAVVDELTLDIGSINLVTTQDRQNNAALFYTKIGVPKSREKRPFIIKRLDLALDSIRVVDYTSGTPRVSLVPVNARIERRDVTEETLPQVINDFAREARLDQVIAQNPAFAQALVQAALNSQASDNDSISERIDKARDGLKEQADNAGKAVNAMIEKLREQIGK